MSKRLVYILDDDEAVRSSMEALLESAGYAAMAFATADEFLEQISKVMPCCALVDIRMPGVNGLELMSIVRARGLSLPIVIITGHGDVTTAVQAMKLGAIDVLQKPFPHMTLMRILESIAEGVQPDTASFGASFGTLVPDGANAQAGRVSLADEVKQRLSSLSPREREILDLIIQGKSSREIAADLSISAATVNNHRSQIKTKMGARTVAHMLAMVTARTQASP